MSSALVRRRYFALDGFRRHLKIVLNMGGNRHRHAAGKNHLGRVGHETRLGHNHLVAGVHDGGQRQVQGFRNADRDEQFALGVVTHAVQALQVARQGLAQLDGAGVRGVSRLAAVERGDAGPQDALGALARNPARQCPGR